MRILIAEDDEALARFVRQGSGRRALFSRYFAEPARIAATEVDYDVVVHGLNLPKLDGGSVLGPREFRETEFAGTGADTA